MRRLGRLAIAGVTVLGLQLGLILPGVAAADEAAILRMGISPAPTGLPGSINPFSGGGTYPTTVTYQQLTGRDSDWQPIPQFAESWSVSEDGTTWTFKIAPDRKWSDGEPATAHDVAFTYNYLLDSIGTPNELGLGFNRVTPAWANLESVVATDDETVVMTLGGPSLWPLESNVWIVPQHIWKDVTAEAALNTFASPIPSVGSGPFVVTDFKSGELVRLEPNPNYPGPGPFIDEWVISIFPTADAAIAALKNGEIDAFDGLSGTAYQALANEPDIVAESTSSPWYIYLTFNTQGTEVGGTTDALSDPAFRDALGWAIDNRTLAEKAAGGEATPGLSIFTPITASYYEATTAALDGYERTFDPDEARRRLDAAGYVDSDGDGIREDKAGKPLSIRLFIHTALPLFAPAAQFVQDWLGEVGVEVTTTAMEIGTLFEKMTGSADSTGGDWDLAMLGRWPEPFATTTLDTWLSESFGASNPARWSSAEYDALYAQLSASVDESERTRLAGEAAALFYREAPALVMLNKNMSVAHRTDRFTGWTLQPAEGGRSMDTFYPEQTWVNLRPVGEAASAEPSAATTPAAPSAAASEGPSGTPAPGAETSTDNTGLIAAGLGALVVVAGVGVYLMRRRAA